MSANFRENYAPEPQPTRINWTRVAMVVVYVAAIAVVALDMFVWRA